jgi:hypothetical protein
MIGMALRRGKRVLVAVGAVLVVAGVVAWHTLGLSDLMRIGAGYTAQQICSCLLVSGRSLESCKTDLDPLARRLISVEVGTDGVKASAFGLTSARARFEKGYGCSLTD